MGEEVQEVLDAVFGSDSDDAESEEDMSIEGNDEWDGAVESDEVGYEWSMRAGAEVWSHMWSPVEHVRGLWRCAAFLKPSEQERLVDAIEAEGWFTRPSHNQAMRFGDLPGWAATLSSLLYASISSTKNCDKLGTTGPGVPEAPSGHEVPLASNLLERVPLFDQMIVNSYQPGEGIGPHVDLARFEDGIAVLSLLSPSVMRFRKCEKPAEKVDVLLSPGDMILLSGDARYKWTHEINRDEKEQVWAGEVLKQGRRISVTLRRLCPQETLQAL